MKKAGFVIFALFILVMAAGESIRLWGAILGHPLRTLLLLVVPFALVLVIGGTAHLIEKMKA